MTAEKNPYLRNIWYYAMPAKLLGRGAMVPMVLLGEPVVFCRGADDKVFALRDVCPHRAVPLSRGRFDGEQVECCYHGWKFDRAGVCQHIPSLTGHEGVEANNICVQSYPVAEQQGNLWIFMQERGRKIADLPPCPMVPEIGADATPMVVEVRRFPCFIDHAVIGLMDPAHGPFVHQSWWWRSQKSIHEKAKAFGPSYLGFTMKRHRPSKNSLAYKILGGVPETEISFQLPGIRLEHIKAGRRIVCNLTTTTPVGMGETIVTHVMYSNSRLLKTLTPIIKIFVKVFLGQDQRVVEMQQEGLRYEQNLMLIRDADTQARWYNQLKNEYARAMAEGRDFVNPVKDVILRWRS